MAVGTMGTLCFKILDFDGNCGKTRGLGGCSLVPSDRGPHTLTTTPVAGTRRLAGLGLRTKPADASATRR